MKNLSGRGGAIFGVVLVVIAVLAVAGYIFAGKIADKQMENSPVAAPTEQTVAPPTEVADPTVEPTKTLDEEVVEARPAGPVEEGAELKPGMDLYFGKPVKETYDLDAYSYERLEMMISEISSVLKQEDGDYDLSQMIELDTGYLMVPSEAGYVYILDAQNLVLHGVVAPGEFIQEEKIVLGDYNFVPYKYEGREVWVNDPLAPKYEVYK